MQNLGGKTPRVPPLYKYHSVFQTFPCHLLAKELYILKAIIEETTNSSFYRHSKATPQSILNSEVESWNLTIIKLTLVMAMTMFWMRTEIMKEAKMLEKMSILLASFLKVTMVMVTTVMALLTVMVAMTAMILVTHLPVVKLSAKEKSK